MPRPCWKQGNRDYLFRRALYNSYEDRWEQAEADLQSYIEESEEGIPQRCSLARVKLKLRKMDHIRSSAAGYAR